MADTAVALTTTPMDSFTGIIGAATAISAGDTAVVAAAGTTDNLLIEVVNKVFLLDFFSEKNNFFRE